MLRTVLCVSLALACVSVAAAAAATAAPTAPASSSAIVPFTIAVPDAALARLHAKLQLASLPELHQSEGQEAWRRGTSIAFMRRLIDRWKTDNSSAGAISTDRYSWRAREKELNALPHFRTELLGYTIHFMHVRSPRADAVPLLFSHGWPGSFLECIKLLPGLTQPDDPTLPAFHVVCPSIPGYGFSPLPQDGRKTDVRKVAQLFVQLMERLRYSKYVAQVRTSQRSASATAPWRRRTIECHAY